MEKFAELLSKCGPVNLQMLSAAARMEASTTIIQGIVFGIVALVLALAGMSLVLKAIRQEHDAEGPGRAGIVGVIVLAVSLFCLGASVFHLINVRAWATLSNPELEVARRLLVKL